MFVVKSQGGKCAVTKRVFFNRFLLQMQPLAIQHPNAVQTQPRVRWSAQVFWGSHVGIIHRYLVCGSQDQRPSGLEATYHYFTNYYSHNCPYHSATNNNNHFRCCHYCTCNDVHRCCVSLFSELIRHQ